MLEIGRVRFGKGVWETAGRCVCIPAETNYCTWVDFPQPVSPAIITTWLFPTASTICSLKWLMGRFAWSFFNLTNLENCIISKRKRHKTIKLLIRYMYNVATLVQHLNNCLVTYGEPLGSSQRYWYNLHIKKRVITYLLFLAEIDVKQKDGFKLRKLFVWQLSWISSPFTREGIH